MGRRKTYIIKLTVITAAVFVALFLGDAFLRTDEKTKLEQTYRAHNDSINEVNDAFAAKNPFGFTDIPKTAEKSDSVFRIAVMGDSFIYGDGIPYYETWSHLLRNKLDSTFNHIELFSWGLRGWSTLDQYNFFMSHGHTFNIDLLLFAFCHNDPDMKLSKHMDIGWHQKLTPLKRIFPRLTAKILNVLFASSYDTWVNSLYEEENLEKYNNLLFQIRSLENSFQLKTAFLLTPNTLNGKGEMFFSLISKLLAEANIPHLNLHDDMHENFGQIDDRELWANPVNPHPGKTLNAFYAEGAYNLVIKNEFIPHTFKK